MNEKCNTDNVMDKKNIDDLNKFVILNYVCENRSKTKESRKPQ